MTDKHSAKPQMLGYMYQSRYALYLLLGGGDESSVVIEGLDDVVIEDSDKVSLGQLKHHVGKQGSLTDLSEDLWKTIGIWSAQLLDGDIDVSNTILSLITTAKSGEDSIASLIKNNDERDVDAALEKMVEAADKSTNSKLTKSIESFKRLTDAQARSMVNAIQVIDSESNIEDVVNKIKDIIRYSVRREHLEKLYERLEGWWFDKVVRQLSSSGNIPIGGFELHDKIVEIAESFSEESLPIDYVDVMPPEKPDPDADERMFVRQLREIEVRKERIVKAILDYYRAFEQRSRWAREELLVGGEAEQYDDKLIDEWQRFSFAVRDELETDRATAEELKKAGRDILNWMEFKADLRIRPKVTEEYVMRGSYHMLADKNPPSVYWHPEFLERIKEIMGAA